jgi:TPP-dependent trihydroxycyclohexane-1,2-dione (THcHDO) dehydratase
MNLRARRGALLANPQRTNLAVSLSLSQDGQGERMGYPENLLELTLWYPYRKPTQVGGHKCAKVYERNIV